MMPPQSRQLINFCSRSLPIVYIDVNAVPGKLVYGNGIKVWTFASAKCKFAHRNRLTGCCIPEALRCWTLGKDAVHPWHSNTMTHSCVVVFITVCIESLSCIAAISTEDLLK